jgi:hypothetical protein
MPNSRTLVALTELSEWLTLELQKVPDAGGSKITVQYALQTPDAEGCNWSDTVVLGVGKDATPEYLQPYVRQLINAARSRFNLKEAC